MPAATAARDAVHVSASDRFASKLLGHGGGRAPAMMKWGLIPSWAKDEKLAYSTFNARAETVETKPFFRDAFKRTRCLIPVSGYY